MLVAIKNLYKANVLLIAVLTTVLIAALSLLNIKGIQPPIELSNIDKYEHLLAYFVLTLSWFFAVQKTGSLIGHRYLLVLFVFLYGVTMEFLQQMLTDYRIGDYYDVLANSSGILVGVVFYEFIIRQEFKEFLSSEK